ncbi:MAG: hypothetical protein JKY98_11970 [Gammaproteobacteria bacterium]|nr:hypothetical protein [Gammaproteobacteria bacterium]
MFLVLLVTAVAPLLVIRKLMAKLANAIVLFAVCFSVQANEPQWVDLNDANRFFDYYAQVESGKFLPLDADTLTLENSGIIHLAYRFYHETDTWLVVRLSDGAVLELNGVWEIIGRIEDLLKPALNMDLKTTFNRFAIFAEDALPGTFAPSFTETTVDLDSGWYLRHFEETNTYFGVNIGPDLIYGGLYLLTPENYPVPDYLGKLEDWVAGLALEPTLCENSLAQRRDTDRDGICDGLDSEIIVVNGSLTPIAIKATELSSSEVCVQAYAAGPDVAGVTARYSAPASSGLSELLTLAMYDDGTNGDKVAGDWMWTTCDVLQFAEEYTGATRRLNDKVDQIPISFFALSTDGEIRSGSRYIIIHSGPDSVIYADSDSAGAPGSEISFAFTAGGFSNRPKLLGITSTDEEVVAESNGVDVLVTPHMVNIVIDNIDGWDDSIRVSQRYFELFPEDADVAIKPHGLVIFNTEETTGGSVKTIRVKNDVTGTGAPLFDSSASFGSSGNLQQVIYMNNNINGANLIEAFGHLGGCYLDKASLRLCTSSHHTVTTTVRGQMGRSLMESDGMGDYVVPSHRIGLSPPDFTMFEMYQLGLADVAEVPAERYVTDPNVHRAFNTTILESDTELVDGFDIEAIYGVHSDPYTGIQKVIYNICIVVSSSEHGLLTEAEYTYMEFVCRYFGEYHAGEAGFATFNPPSIPFATQNRLIFNTGAPALPQ